MVPFARHLAAVAIGLLASQLSAQEAPRQGPVLQLPVNSVLIPVVVRDAQGRAVGGLKPEDFKVFDQGKPRKIAGFTIESGRPPVVQETNAAPREGASRSSAAQPAPADGQILVFLFDDRHLDADRLEQAKEAVAKLLDSPLPQGTRGLVLSFLGVNSGITGDRATLKAAIQRLKERQGFQQDPGQCPKLSYYQADQIVNRHNGSEFQIAIEKAENCTVAVREPRMLEALVRNTANQSLITGEQDARDTLDFMLNVVQTLSKIPGRRSLVLISPGFLVLEDEAMQRASWILNLAASANIAISALDARGVYDEQTPASDSGAGSIFATMTGRRQEDEKDVLRQDKEIMAELADGAGGTFFHSSNDLAGGLAVLAAEPEYKYLLEVSLNGVKRNGAYHALKVEVDRREVRVQARQSYFAPLEPQKAERKATQAAPEERASAAAPSAAERVPASAAAPASPAPKAAAQPEPAAASPAHATPHDLPPPDRTSYIDLPIDRLKDAVPSLKGIDYDPSQQALPAILAGVAKKIGEVLPRLPDLVSREEVIRFQGSWDSTAPGGLAAAQPSSRDFKYLLQFQHGPGGETSISESRIDSKGRPVNGAETYTALRGFGFAYQWLFFSAAVQPEFRFRYLGEQAKGGRKAFVVAFAQDPRKVSEPAYFQAGGRTEPFYFQGVLWIDRESFDILRLRTDLLAPLAELHLRRLTTELTFRSVPIHGFGAVFWLPSEVEISSDQGAGLTEESHRYSDYHLFHAEARIVAGP